VMNKIATKVVLRGKEVVKVCQFSPSVASLCGIPVFCGAQRTPVQLNLVFVCA